jgi:hypothetical protein
MKNAMNEGIAPWHELQSVFIDDWDLYNYWLCIATMP